LKWNTKITSLAAGQKMLLIFPIGSVDYANYGYVFTISPVSGVSNYTNDVNNPAINHASLHALLGGIPALANENSSAYDIWTTKQGFDFDITFRDGASEYPNPYILSGIDKHILSSFKFIN
ncbi:MAG: hypothetical protein ACREBA_06480, partial [Nitrosotalea sp.]